jgi:hypothetical protein
MQKGDETAHGIFLGERMVDREQRLTLEEAEALAPLDYDGDREQLVYTLQDRAIAYVFDNDGEEIVILAEDFS